MKVTWSVNLSKVGGVSVLSPKAHVLFDSEVIICFSKTFEVSADLTVLESYNGFGIYLSSLS